MSANVWFEEVDNGLVNEILRHVKITNGAGQRVLIGENAVMVRKPEEDFKIEVYPCVSIYNLSYKHDPLRYDPVPVKLGLDKKKKIIEMEETAVPFNLSYQIDFWAQYQVDMNSMTHSWLVKHFRQFNLPVIDDGGVKRTCNCLMKGSVKKSDLVLNKERLFHSIVNLEIWVELDDETRYNMPVVITHDVEAKQKGEEDGDSNIN